MTIQSIWTGLTEWLPKWLSKQRPEVVVLVLILAVMLCGIPWAAHRVEGHINLIGSFHKQEKELLIDAFKQSEQHHNENRVQDRQLIRDLLKSQGVEITEPNPSGVASAPQFPSYTQASP